MIDEERLAEIEARADKAPPPPWGMKIHDDDPEDADVLAALFVSHARDDVPWLIDRVRALTAERDALVADRDAWKARCLGHTPAAKEER